VKRGASSLAARFGQTSPSKRKLGIEPTYLAIVVAVRTCHDIEGGFPTARAIAAVAKCGIDSPCRAVTMGWLQFIGKTDDKQAVFALTPKALALLETLREGAAA
jgi:hypothetical protein